MWRCLPTTEPHMYSMRTPTCTCSFRKLESFVVVMETRVPRSYHLPTSQSLLYPLWQSVHFGASAGDPMAGSRGQLLEAEQTRQEQKGGWVRRWEETGCRWRRAEPSCKTHAPALPFSVAFLVIPAPPHPTPPTPLPRPVNVEVAAVFPHHRLWSASSVPGGGGGSHQ